MKPARTVFHIVVGAALVTVATITAAGAATGQQAPGFEPAPARIAFVDSTGNLLRAPSFEIAAAYPGMPAQRSAISLRNIGKLQETFSVSSKVQRSGARSLDDVLSVSIEDRGTGEVIYRGRLSGLSFIGSRPLAPGQLASYEVAITWPATDKDNLYQGLGLSFSLRGNAEPTTG